MLPFLFFEAGASYRDRAPWSLHTQISGGAYAGLETTVAKKVFLRQLTRDIGSIAPSCRIAFFNDFPAGYLLTPAEPDTNSTWPMASPSSRGSESGDLGRYYERHGFPDMVVLLKRIPAGSAATSLHKEYPARAFPFAVGRKSYVSVAKRSDYVVYGRTARCD
jgi:hypothetical protein